MKVDDRTTTAADPTAALVTAKIYELCIDRYEHLDAELRSLASPAAKKAAEAEKKIVEAIVRAIVHRPPEAHRSPAS